MDAWVRAWTLLGTILGAVVIFCGLVSFFAGGSVVGLLIALAVLIVGPVEDWLQGWASRRFPDDPDADRWITLIDRVTSALFLGLLLAVLFIAG